MNVLLTLPIILSAVLLGAHFFRAGLIPVVIFVLMCPFLLLFRRAWAARFVQIVLVLGTLEWFKTLFILMSERHAGGQPWIRLAIIIGLVAVFTGCSASIFRCASLKTRYKLKNSLTEKSDTYESSQREIR
jgi:hypothetical protein